MATRADRLKPMARALVYWAKRLRLPLADFGHYRTTVIVRYHSVSDARGGNYRYVSPAVAVPAAVFEEQIAFLAQRYRCITMDDVLEALVTGRPLPPNSAVVTFDDGYRDNYGAAFPILRRHGVPATFYVTTGCLDGGPALWTSEIRYLVYATSRRVVVDPLTGTAHDLGTPTARERTIRAVKASLVTLPRSEREHALADVREQASADTRELGERMLTWGQVREMAAAGMRFGAHTVSHPRLPSMPQEEARGEIVESKAELTARLGTPIDHFAYPNPADGQHWSAAVVRLLIAAGFRTAVTSEDRYVQAADDRFSLGRVPPSSQGRGLAWDLERAALRASLTAIFPREAGAAGLSESLPAQDRDAAFAQAETDTVGISAALAEVSLARQERLAVLLKHHRTALADLDAALEPLRAAVRETSHHTQGGGSSGC